MKLTRMLLTKLSNFVSRIIIITIYFCLLFSNVNAEESIDIWKNQKSTIIKKNDTIVFIAKKDQIPLVENIFRISAV